MITHTYSYKDGEPQVDCFSLLFRQACWLPRGHDAAGREPGHSHPHHQLHEEVRGVERDGEVRGGEGRGEGGVSGDIRD